MFPLGFGFGALVFPALTLEPPTLVFTPPALTFVPPLTVDEPPVLLTLGAAPPYPPLGLGPLGLGL